MSKLKNPLGRLGRLFHRLQDVDHEILYVPGAANFLPDFLSRSYDSAESEINSIELKSSINWIEEQAKDAEIRQIIQLIRGNKHDEEWLKVNDGSRWLRNRRELYVSLGILKYGDDKIVCPEHLKTQILQHYHDSPFSGHRGFETALNGIRNRYFWNYMPSQIKMYCQSCSACQTFMHAYIT